MRLVFSTRLPEESNLRPRHRMYLVTMYTECMQYLSTYPEHCQAQELGDLCPNGQFEMQNCLFRKDCWHACWDA